MYKINKLQHGKRFVRDFHTRWFCIRNLTRSLRSLVRFQILHQAVLDTVHVTVFGQSNVVSAEAMPDTFFVPS